MFSSGLLQALELLDLFVQHLVGEDILKTIVEAVLEVDAMRVLLVREISKSDSRASRS